MTTVTEPAPARKAPAPRAAPPVLKSEARVRAERRLGLTLCAPAVVVMLAVAFYPIAYAFYLSLQRYDLRFPSQSKWIWFSNYGTVLSSNIWWKAFGNTAIIVVISVAI